MKKLLFVLLAFSPLLLQAQDPLPSFTIEGFGDNIFIRWKSQYNKPIESISIQRSYDSLKHFSTIGSVLNAQFDENGYTDYRPPYSRMYYRIFIVFSDGTYEYTKSKRPYWEPRVDDEIITDEIPKIEPSKKDQPQEDVLNMDDEIPLEPSIDSTDNKTDPEVITKEKPPVKKDIKREPWRVQPGEVKRHEPGGILEKEPEKITYPSKRIFTNGHQVIIRLPDALVKHYTVKFFDEENNFIFDIKLLKNDYLILEKMYFRKSGWFYFELYDRGRLVEKNKLQIPKDKDKNKR